MKVFKTYKHGLAAPAGDRTVWAVPCPPECDIRSIAVKQQGGTPVAAFTVELYDSESVIANSTSVGGPDPALHVPDPAMGLVCAPLPGANGLLQKFFTDGVPYCNGDGGVSSRKRKIYVEITIPTGTGTTTWDVSIRGTSDIG